MKTVIVVVISALAAASCLPAAAKHRPTVFCSETGDYCVSAKREDGVRKLRIALAAKYFSRYRLCVTGPNDDRTCKTFRIESMGNGIYGDVVAWRRHFPDEGPGAYKVRWKNTDAGFRSKVLGFHEN